MLSFQNRLGTIYADFNNEFSSYMKESKSILAIGVITAETEEEAKYIAGPVELMWARMRTIPLIYHF
ncbi:hypothetical protein D7Z54_35305 [Salibacterium salarium]|uniref:Uncharacterized protein n=1 Tax=Salibacterium salarium TaxID=284579 RepID=A0A428MRJ5_9BACI|nr:hypothetical protein [Salibacterium salarium]RSL28691.1 hypothetical protein D7Z54_35305 [Salibacterium salarium]